jgi:hypothetical protein
MALETFASFLPPSDSGSRVSRKQGCLGAAAAAGSARERQACSRRRAAALAYLCEHGILVILADLATIILFPVSEGVFLVG